MSYLSNSFLVWALPVSNLTVTKSNPVILLSKVIFLEYVFGSLAILSVTLPERSNISIDTIGSLASTVKCQNGPQQPPDEYQHRGQPAPAAEQGDGDPLGAQAEAHGPPVPLHPGHPTHEVLRWHQAVTPWHVVTAQ